MTDFEKHLQQFVETCVLLDINEVLIVQNDFKKELSDLYKRKYVKIENGKRLIPDIDVDIYQMGPVRIHVKSTDNAGAS